MQLNDFHEKDKMTSSNHMKYELEVLKELNLKSFWKLFFNLELFGFIQIIFSKNKIYGK